VTLDFEVSVSTESCIFKRGKFDDGFLLLMIVPSLLIPEGALMRDMVGRSCSTIRTSLIFTIKNTEKARKLLLVLCLMQRSRSYYRNESIVVGALHNTGRALYLLEENKRARHVFKEALQYAHILAEKPLFDKNKLALHVVSTKTCLRCL